MTALKSHVQRWNDDKPHRCPDCHGIVTIAKEDRRFSSDMTWLEIKIRTWLDLMPDTKSSFVVHTCCTCGTQFARWPALARLLPKSRLSCDWDHNR